MSIGVISISTSAKKEPSGAPFTSGAADNGLSVDAVTKKIVLGNDVGDVTAPARLLSDREIITTDAVGTILNIILNSIQFRGVRSLLTGDSITVETQDFATGNITAGNSAAQFNTANIEAATGDGGTSSITASNSLSGISTVAATVATSGLGGIATLRVGAGAADILDITSGAVAGRVQFRVQGLFTTMAINTTTFCTLVQSDTAAPFNNATLQVSGTHTYRKFPQSNTGTLNLNRDTDSAKVIRNSGALVINFPNMIAANFRDGFFIDVLVNNAAGITINAGASVTIRYGSLATSVGGAISSTDVGAFIRIIIIDGTTYAVCFSIGLWTLT